MAELHSPQLRKAVTSRKLHPDAAVWLENAINPFPDYPETPAGVPSEGADHTATKIVQKLINITPPSLPPGTATTWSCNVFLMPVDSFDGIAMQSGALDDERISGIVTPASSGSDQPGIITVVKSWDEGVEDNANPFSSQYQPAKAELQGIRLGSTWEGEGAVRLASVGYEITDNTPARYRGGNMINWRKTSTAADVDLQVTSWDVSTSLNKPTRFFGGFPASNGDAFRIPGSTSTPFEEGTYVVGTFSHRLEDFEYYSKFNSKIGRASCRERV